MWLVKKQNNTRRDWLTQFFDEINEIDPFYTDQSLQVTDEETKKKVYVELPGFDKKEIDISYEKGILTIKASSQSSAEFTVKDTTRSVYVGDIDFESSKADYKNGILSIELAKLESQKPKTLKIS